MDCSHDSSRCHAAMFFSQAFPFQVILHRFDKHDGLRRLFNVVSICHSVVGHEVIQENMESVSSYYCKVSLTMDI